MRIDLSNGYVLMKDEVTRKIDRDYQERLFKNSKLETTGEVDNNGSPIVRYGIDPVASDRAAEGMILGLINEAFEFGPEIDGKITEKRVSPSQDWLDNLSSANYAKIEREALRIKKESDENAKKL